MVEEEASEETKLSPEWEMALRNEAGCAGSSEAAFGQRQLEFIVAETETNGSVQAIEREPVFRTQEV